MLPSDQEALHQLATERAQPEFADLDLLPLDDLVALLCADVRRVPDAIAGAYKAICAAVSALSGRLEAGGRLIYVGAGTAGRLGMLDAAEAGPTFGLPPGRIVAVLAGGPDAASQAVETAEDDAAAGRQAMVDLMLTRHDAVVGISASGRTPYVLGAIDTANTEGALTIGIACNESSALSRVAHLPIEIPVGPEVIAGSTRLNAGTAQKVVLNILSTAVMIRLGRTYGNLMVELRTTNDKLRDRAARIVAQITGATAEQSISALRDANWSIKEATLLLLGAASDSEAKQVLQRTGGRLRPAVTLVSGRVGPAGKSGPWKRLGVAAAFTGKSLIPGDVAISGDEIVAFGLPGKGRGIAAPGLVDLQVNGYAGVDAAAADAEGLATIGTALLREGIFAYLPTLISGNPERTREAVTRLSRLASQQTTQAARVLGVHLEGPFLSASRSGTHPVTRLLAPDPAILSDLLESGFVRMVTLAPELPGSADLIAVCIRRGAVVSLGHTAASAAQAHHAFQAGARAVTHIFNGMEPLSARQPGTAAAALTTPGIAIQLIADARHVAAEMIKLAFACAPGRCILVSDTTAAARTDQPTADLGEVPVSVAGGVARRADGTIAGAVSSLAEGLANLGLLGIDPATALASVTHRPAALIGQPSAGTLSEGQRADLIVLTEDLVVERVLRAGREL